MSEMDPEIEGIGKMWSVLDAFDSKTQLRMVRAVHRRVTDGMRQTDKDYELFLKLKAKFEPIEEVEIDAGPTPTEGG